MYIVELGINVLVTQWNVFILIRREQNKLKVNIRTLVYSKLPILELFKRFHYSFLPKIVGMSMRVVIFLKEINVFDAISFFLHPQKI